VGASLQADVAITHPSGATRHRSLDLAVTGEEALGTLEITAPVNGCYTLTATVDPHDAIQETDESNNTAGITLPVVVAGRNLNFVWYREVPTLRWATCVTSAGETEDRRRLAERGIMPLRWEYGGMSWSYYDHEKAKTDPAAVLADIETVFDGKFTSELPPYCFGEGIDETGGYPGTFGEQASMVSMRAMVRAKQAQPERVFAVWHGGGLRTELARYYRQGADLLLLETYIFRAIPGDLGIEDIYQVLRDRLDPLVRSTDMLVPAYGNWCHTLLALDSSERPDQIDLGEQEQVIRYIRRICPEMRGIAWYNGGYGGYGMERTEETDRHHEAVLANADRLFLDYYVRPCVTLQPESLWVRSLPGGEVEITAALSNIGAMDSGPVVVQFTVDGQPVGEATASAVPAGRNRTQNRTLLRQAVKLLHGTHRFEARILQAKQATVLDAVAETQRFVG